MKNCDQPNKLRQEIVDEDTKQQEAKEEVEDLLDLDEIQRFKNPEAN